MVLAMNVLSVYGGAIAEQRMTSLKRVMRTSKMAQQLGVLSAKPDNPSLISGMGATWWKERTDSLKLSPGLHT